MLHVKRLLIITLLVITLAPASAFATTATACVPRQPFTSTVAIAYAPHLGDPLTPLSASQATALAAITGCLLTSPTDLGPLEPTGFLIDYQLYLVTYRGVGNAPTYLVHRGWEVTVLDASQWWQVQAILAAGQGGVRRR